MITPHIRNLWKFFHAHAGGIVGQRAVNALHLARAYDWLGEQVENGVLIVCWECDQYADRGPRDWDWSDADIRRWDRAEHEVLWCSIRDAEGNVLTSLGGIWDPDQDYRRVVEAELAEEVWSDARERVRRELGVAVRIGGPRG